MKYYRIIGIVCVWIFFIGQVCAQSVPDNECLQLVALNDSDGVLKEMVIYPPIFCAMHDGKRLKMKISNEGEKVMRKTYFYLFYKKKRICRIHLPNMKKGETCEFGVNIHDRFSIRTGGNWCSNLRKGNASGLTNWLTADRRPLLIVFFYI